MRYLFLLFLISYYSCQSQVNFNANLQIPDYNGEFGFGSNFGYYPFIDQELADLAAGNPEKGITGAAVTTIRPSLPEIFLEQWGYDIRHDAFAHYEQIGLKNIVAFIGYPSEAHRDNTFYCDEESSRMFDNMYEPIWDNGENGTPVNDNNYLALYLYKTIQNYGDQVRIWEIWNEPDFDTGGNAWKPSTMEGNWWHNVPAPCEYALKAPVYHYIRMLRVCYEVIKTYDPQDFVAVGGLGYPSFLDVILRYSDNPDGGAVNAQYPLKGGAYFDMLSFHSYPHIDGSLREWSNDINGFVYHRNSDRAAQGVIDNKERFETVLTDHGYGTTFPRKPWIITECNIPRREYGEYIGSDEAQRNFIIKSLVKVQQAGILQFHIYQLAETKSVETATNEFELMGLYAVMDPTDLKKQRLTPAGVAFRTTSLLLDGYKYDRQGTMDLELPEGVGGVAFKKNQDRRYVLWAITTKDKNENATAVYSLPEGLNTPYFKVMKWDWSETGFSTILSSNELSLHGDPVFVQPVQPGDPDFEVPARGEVVVFPNPASGTVNVQFNLAEITDTEISLLDMEGKLVKVVLVDTELSPGFYQKTCYLLPIADGIYFLKIKFNNTVKYQKIMNISK